MHADRYHYYYACTGETPREAFATLTLPVGASFVVLPTEAGANAFDAAIAFLGAEDMRISDPFGPCGCLANGYRRWLFFGVAFYTRATPELPTGKGLPLAPR